MTNEHTPAEIAQAIWNAELELSRLKEFLESDAGSSTRLPQMAKITKHIDQLQSMVNKFEAQYVVKN